MNTVETVDFDPDRLRQKSSSDLIQRARFSAIQSLDQGIFDATLLPAENIRSVSFGIGDFEGFQHFSYHASPGQDVVKISEGHSEKNLILYKMAAGQSPFAKVSKDGSEWLGTARLHFFILAPNNATAKQILDYCDKVDFPCEDGEYLILATDQSINDLEEEWSGEEATT